MTTHQVYREFFICDYPGCSNKATNKKLLQYHIQRVHEKVRNLECYCGKKFFQKHELVTHKKYFHDKIKDVQCDVCQKMLVSSNALKNHKSALHPKNGEKPKFQCEICGTTFSQQIVLKKHLNANIAIRNFSSKTNFWIIKSVT
jgi:uncharacterized Zn-finger protein